MITAKVVELKEEPKFKPVTIQITIDDQDTLDRLTSLFNHANVSVVLGSQTDIIRNCLIRAGGSSSKYIDMYTTSFIVINKGDN